MAHINAPVPRPGRKDCPSWLVEIIRALLAKEPRDRPPARAVARAIAAQRTPTRSRRSIATVLGAVALILGLLLVVTMTRNEPETPPRAATPPSLEPDPPLPEALPEPELARPQPNAAAEAATTSGCDQPAPFTRFGLVDGVFQAYVPARYSSAGPRPLVILLHNRDVDPQRAMLERFRRTAEAEGLVLIAPASPSKPAWNPPDLESDLGFIRLAVEAAAAELCIDLSRVFAVGHAAGGWITDRLSCEPWIAAVATYAFAHIPPLRFCEPTIPKPHLMLAPTQSQHEPLEGGVGCDDRERVAISVQTDAWRGRNRCTKRGADEVVGASQCWSYECETALRVCHVTGGHQWPDAPPRTVFYNPQGCDGPPGDPTFDASAVIWRFFADAPALPPHAWFRP